MARALAHQKKFDEAIGLMRKLILIPPERAGLYAELASMCAAARSFEPAARYYRRASDLELDNANYAASAAATLVTIGQIEETFEYARRALKLAPNHLGAINALGLAFKWKDQFTAAAEQFRKMTLLKPDFEIGWANLTQVLGDAGDVEAALEANRRVIALNPARLSSSHLMLTLYPSTFTPLEVAGEHFEYGRRLAADVSHKVVKNLEEAYRTIWRQWAEKA